MKKETDQSIPYPRFVIRRKMMDFIGRLLVRILARPQLEGLENIPETGPVILAGNHVSMLEPVFMFLFARQPVEPVGAGDMPFEGFIDAIVGAYGYIPVNRGLLDRKAMNQALGVLKQGGFLGIYPEGGTWDPGNMRAQIGVAWLSHKGSAVVVPIGFSGFRNSWGRVFKFQRPRLRMKVGKPIPALKVEDDSRQVKEVYQEYADLVLERIQELVDPAEQLDVPVRSEFELEVKPENGEKLDLPGHETIAQFFFNSVMLDSISINLKRQIGPLYPVAMERTLNGFASALEAALDVLNDNAAFFTYRLGMERGRQLEQALKSLRDYLAGLTGTEKVCLHARARFDYADGRVEELRHAYVLEPA